MSDFPLWVAKSSHAAFVKSFGRRQAYESPRGTNPRMAGARLWDFRLRADPRRLSRGCWKHEAWCGRTASWLDPAVVLARISDARGLRPVAADERCKPRRWPRQGCGGRWRLGVPAHARILPGGAGSWGGDR